MCKRNTIIQERHIKKKKVGSISYGMFLCLFIVP